MNETYYVIENRRKTIFDRVYGEPVSWVLAIFSIAFAFMGISMLDLTTYSNLYYDGILAGIIIGLIIHESAHKFAGRRNGCFSMYVATLGGILITLISGFLPIKILVPGYTSIICYGSITRRGQVEISAWGPITNIILAFISLLVLFMGFPWKMFVKGFAEINAWLALFNLLPIPPLDGSKILRYDIRTWIILILLSILLFIIL